MADIGEVSEQLGQDGRRGVALLLAGLLVVWSQNRKAAVGASLVVAGVGMVAKGVVETALEEMGMSGML